MFAGAWLTFFGVSHQDTLFPSLMSSWGALYGAVLGEEILLEPSVGLWRVESHRVGRILDVPGALDDRPVAGHPMGLNLHRHDNTPVMIRCRYCSSSR